MRFVWAVLILAAIPTAAELGYGFAVDARDDADIALAAYYAEHRDAIAAVVVRWISLSLLVHTLAWRNAAFMAAFFAAAVAAGNLAVIELAFGADPAIVQHDAAVRGGLAVLFAIAAWATATFVRAPD